VVEQDVRFRGLVDAGIALTSELSLDGVLRQLVETAARLTGARYAALGVIDPSGNRLERFITTGIDEDTIREIGDFPVGRGVLGVLIRAAKPLRLHDIADDARSVGFPPAHPRMRTFLGVPILLRGTAYGNLYLTEKDGGNDFTADDEELTTLLAAQAAVAVENARLYEATTRWMHQLETLTEIGNTLASEPDLAILLKLIAERVRELLRARFVFIALPDDEGDLRIEAAADHEGIDHGLGLVIPRHASKSGRVLDRGRPERVDSMLDHETARRFAEFTALPVPVSGIFVPLVVRDRAIGVITIHDKIGDGLPGDLRFTDYDFRLAQVLGTRAAVAVDLAQRVEGDAFRRIVEAQELERRRLARELHDDTGQALTSMLLGLRALEEARDDDERRAGIGALRELVVTTLQDVRRLAVELRPRALDDLGLVPALERLAQAFREQTGTRVQLEARLEERLPSELETALYRIVQEALTNVMKHARARNVSIVLTRRSGAISVLVEDDGVGFDAEAAGETGLGLLGMRERLALASGTLTVESSPGAGTTIVAEVPLHRVGAPGSPTSPVPAQEAP
jgi:two-component system, NarL family, sensor histidine kinase DevS